MDNLFGKEEIVDVSTGAISLGGQSYEYYVTNEQDMIRLLQRKIDCEWMEVTGGPNGWTDPMCILFKVPGRGETYRYDRNIYVENYEPDVKTREITFRKHLKHHAFNVSLLKKFDMVAYKGVPEFVFDKLIDIFNDIADNIKCGNERF